MNLKAIYNSIVKDTHAVSPIVASLILIVVAVVGAATIGVMMGIVGEDVGEQADADQVGDASKAMIQLVASDRMWEQLRPIAESHSKANPGIGFLRHDTNGGAAYSAVKMGVADIGISDGIGREKAIDEPTADDFLLENNLQEHCTLIKFPCNNAVELVFFITYGSAAPIEQSFINYVRIRGFDAIPSASRIVSLAPSITESLFAVGAGDRIVGVTVFCDYPAEAKDIKRVGGFWPPSPEEIVNATPDIIFGKAHHREQIAGIGKTDIAVIVDDRYIAEILSNMQIFGVNTGNRDKAETVVSDMRSRIQAVEYRAAGHPEPRVLLMLDPAWGFWSGGTDTFMDCMIDIAGGRNWRTDTGWVNVGIEYLLADPPCIFIAVGPYCMDAVGTQFPNSRVYNLTCSSMTQRPGPRIIYPIEEMNRYIHP